MTVNLTRIYTKLGDAGETHLGDMSRVSKQHPRVEAYGTVDELNAVLGVALTQPGLPANVTAWLRRMQNDLLDLGADLSVPATEAGRHDPSGRIPVSASERERLRITAEYTAWLEQACDEVNATLPPLRSFVIPGGTPASAHLHICRTVCRRAERDGVRLGEADGEIVSPAALKYLNRLSDLLFVAARFANDKGAGDVLWRPGATR